MLRRVAPLIGSWREIKFTARESYFKRNWKGVPFNQIPEWVDEGVDIGFIDARTTIRSIAFQKQQRKNAINRLSAVTIVDNSKYGVGQHLSQPKMVTSYRRQFRFHLGSVGDRVRNFWLLAPGSMELAPAPGAELSWSQVF